MATRTRRAVTKRKTATKTTSKRATKAAPKKAAVRTAKKAVRTAAAECYIEFKDGGVRPIHEACSKDGYRPALAHPWLERTGPPSKRRFFLLATDSYELVRLPVTVKNRDGDAIDVDESVLGTIDVGAIKEWAKAAKSKKANPLTRRLHLTAEQATLTTEPGVTRSWSRPKLVHPKFQSLLEPPLKGAVEDFAVGVSLGVLTRAAKAMGFGEEGAMVLRFMADANGGPNGLRPILLSHDGKPAAKLGDLDSIGIVMPIRIRS